MARETSSRCYLSSSAHKEGSIFLPGLTKGREVVGDTLSRQVASLYLEDQMATHLKGKTPGYPALRGLQGHTNITANVTATWGG